METLVLTSVGVIISFLNSHAKSYILICISATHVLVNLFVFAVTLTFSQEKDESFCSNLVEKIENGSKLR